MTLGEPSVCIFYCYSTCQSTLVTYFHWPGRGSQKHQILRLGGGILSALQIFYVSCVQVHRLLLTQNQLATRTWGCAPPCIWCRCAANESWGRGEACQVLLILLTFCYELPAAWLGVDSQLDSLISLKMILQCSGIDAIKVFLDATLVSFMR
jgi:hypothetical protein